MELPGVVSDLDHVITRDGKIYRVLGNADHPELFLGYNIYSPHGKGDRSFQGRSYVKNFLEDEQLTSDAFEIFSVLHRDDIAEIRDPYSCAARTSRSFRYSIWFDLYAELVAIFGLDNVGMFGSSMFGMHLSSDGTVRKDVDFVIRDIANVGLLRHHLPGIQARLGFTRVDAQRQARQARRYARVFRNSNNTLPEVISRRWSALQLSADIVSTIRFRDTRFRAPLRLLDSRLQQAEDVTVTGLVTAADTGNLFPRMFRVLADGKSVPVYIFWWKFSSPVENGDSVSLCGTLLDLAGRPAIRISNFNDHWLQVRAPIDRPAEELTRI